MINVIKKLQAHFIIIIIITNTINIHARFK